ncbi:putative reverse transcriptase domain-containing protein [Tanacetum coccineum]
MAQKRTTRSSPATTTTTTTPVTDAQLKALIDQGVADALAARDADRSRNGKDNHDSGTGVRRQAPLAREMQSNLQLNSWTRRSAPLLNVRLTTRESLMTLLRTIRTNNKQNKSKHWKAYASSLVEINLTEDLNLCALNATITMTVSVLQNATSATELAIWPVTIGVLQMPILLTTKGALRKVKNLACKMRRMCCVSARGARYFKRNAQSLRTTTGKSMCKWQCITKSVYGSPCRDKPRLKRRYGNKNKHEEHLKVIMELLKKEELYAKFSKCEFWIPKRYYEDYMEGFLKIAKPMTKLTKKGVKFDWGDKAEAAFQLIKQKLCSAPILALLEGSKDFCSTIAMLSHKDWGAVLMQREKEGHNDREVGNQSAQDGTLCLNWQELRVAMYGDLRTVNVHEIPKADHCNNDSNVCHAAKDKAGTPKFHGIGCALEIPSYGNGIISHG